jgi:hypothetical protein
MVDVVWADCSGIVFAAVKCCCEPTDPDGGQRQGTQFQAVPAPVNKQQ